MKRMLLTTMAAAFAVAAISATTVSAQDAGGYTVSIPTHVIDDMRSQLEQAGYDVPEDPAAVVAMFGQATDDSNTNASAPPATATATQETRPGNQASEIASLQQQIEQLNAQLEQAGEPRTTVEQDSVGAGGIRAEGAIIESADDSSPVTLATGGVARSGDINRNIGQPGASAEMVQAQLQAWRMQHQGELNAKRIEFLFGTAK